MTTLLALTAMAGPSPAIQSDVAFPSDVYARRRARLQEQVGNAPIIVPGAYLIRNGGRDKQDPNFWYLTGVESPYAILVMVPSAGGWREALFLPAPFQFAGAQYPMDDVRFRRAAWNRPIRRLAPGQGARAATGIAETYPIDEFAERLRQLAGGAQTIYFVRDNAKLYAPPGVGVGVGVGVSEPLSVRQQLENAIADLLPGVKILDLTPLVERMRLIKDEHEIRALTKAADISVHGLLEVMRTVRSGMTDLEVAGLMEYVWKREGSPRVSFGPIVASGPDAVSLYTLRSENYNAVDRVMKDGDLLYIDYGAAEFRTYTSDICRVYPVSGRFTREQREYYEIVLEAQDSALAQIRPGVIMLQAIRAAAEVFRRHGFEEYEDIDRMGEEKVWGVMPSPTYWLARGGALTDYSGARGTGVRDLGHHIGLEALDSRDYSMPLMPGMVFTVEPKLYIPELGIAIMIEDMILVTEEGYENLSAGAPKRVDEIERLMSAR